MTKKVKAVKAWAQLFNGEIYGDKVGYLLLKERPDGVDYDRCVQVEIRPVKPIKRRGK